MFILKTNNNLKSREYYYLREKEEFAQPIFIKEVKMGGRVEMEREEAKRILMRGEKNKAKNEFIKIKPRPSGLLSFGL